MNKGLPIKK